MRNPNLWLLAVTFAAASCAKTSTIGTSGHKPADTAPPTAPAKPKLPSMITGGPTASLGYNQPILGDVDGDGFDDFLVQGGTLDLTGETLGKTFAYLFYGRESFSPEIDTSQADAVFESDLTGAWALGDINGDGLSDFSLAQPGNSFDLVFGDRTRYAGHYSAHSVGTTWTGVPLPPLFASELPAFHAVRGAGDVNGDGIDDLLVSHFIVSDDPQLEATLGFGLQQVEYLVLGHEGEWPSGMWDPATLPAAWLGTQTLRRPLTPDFDTRKPLQGLPAGDLDGDGYADLVALGEDTLFVFYGGKDRLAGALDAPLADAALKLPPQELDDFGSEIAYAYYRQVVALGDLDADGAADLGVFIGFDLRVTYGARWAGTLDFQDDFVIQTSSREEGMLGAAAAGDVDTDDFPDLALMTAVYPTLETTFDENGEAIIPNGHPRTKLYVLRGTGTRALGFHRLTSDDIRILGKESNPAGAWGPPSENPYPSVGAVLSMAGDVDGDGSCDILAGSTSDPFDLSLPPASVLLIPSTPRAPE